MSPPRPAAGARRQGLKGFAWTGPAAAWAGSCLGRQPIGPAVDWGGSRLGRQWSGPAVDWAGSGLGTASLSPGLARSR